MRRLIALPLLFLALVASTQQIVMTGKHRTAAASPATPGYVSGSGTHANGAGTSGAITLTVTPTIAAGTDFLFVVESLNSDGTSTCTAVAPTSTHVIYGSAVTTQNGNHWFTVAYLGTISGGYTGSETITAAPTASGGLCEVSIGSTEYTPATGGSGAFDKSALGGGGFQGQPFPSGTTSTTAHANEVLIGWIMVGEDVTAVSPFVDNYTWMDNNFNRLHISSRVVSSTGAYQATWSASGSDFPSAGIMTFF